MRRNAQHAFDWLFSVASVAGVILMSWGAVVITRPTIRFGVWAHALSAGMLGLAVMLYFMPQLLTPNEIADRAEVPSRWRSAVELGALFLLLSAGYAVAYRSVDGALYGLLGGFLTCLAWVAQTFRMVAIMGGNSDQALALVSAQYRRKYHGAH